MTVGVWTKKKEEKREFFFNDTATTEIYTLSLHDALPILLLLVGDGPDRAKAEKMCREMSICEKVKFLGKQDYIMDVLSVSDLFLMPSELESFGLSALEAMSCEVPVIASAVGGLKELITDDTGYLIDKDDIDEMARKSIELLTDEKLHDEMGRNARTRAVEVFDTSIIIPKYEDYYDKICTS